MNNNIELSNKPLNENDMLTQKRQKNSLIFALASLACGILPFFLMSFCCCCGAAFGDMFLQIFFAVSYLISLPLSIAAVVLANIAMTKADKSSPVAIIGLIFGVFTTTNSFSGIIFQTINFITSILEKL